MLAAIAAAAIVCAASLVLGQALLAAAGARGWNPLAAGVGFAVLLVLCGLGGRVVVCGAAVLIAAAWLVARKGREGSDPSDARGTEGSDPSVWLGAGVLAALGAAIPFLVNDRIGVLGAGLVNDDMANHLLMADWAQNGTSPTPELIDDGYPLGPHSIAATLADLLGTGLVEAFAGLTLAIAALAAITALAALGNLPPLRRTLAGALAALPYLGAAYLAQGAFKEPIQALLLITFVLLLAQSRLNAGIPLAVLLAAAIYNYSFPGLFWVAGAAALYLAFLYMPRPSEALQALRRSAVPIAITLGLALLLTLPEWGRVLTFTGFGAFDPAGEQTGLGNLRQALSPLEALGVWPTGEFRLSPADASIPAAAFYLAGLLGAAAVGIGIARVIQNRHEDAQGVALVAALASATLIYLGAAIAGTPYTSAKALAIAAPVAMLVAVRALLLSRSAFPNRLSLAAPVLATAFVLAAGLSTFLALRQAPVAPATHADELAQIRPLVDGEPVLFLGRDDFIAWHLRGSPVSTHIKNFFSTDRIPVRADYPESEEKFDFDAVSAETLDRFDWVLTTSSAYASQPPESFTEAKRTPSYVLWKRTGPTIPRELAGEGAAPGAPLRCDEVDGPVATAIWPVPPVEGDESAWEPSATVIPGRPASQTITLPRGIVELSLAYDSPRPLELRVTGPATNSKRLAVPANLDFRGPTPPFPASPALEIQRRGDYEIEVSLTEAPAVGRLLGAEGEAHLRGLYAVETGSPPQRRAGRPPCGKYTDWVR